jgi:hypothetical protein
MVETREKRREETHRHRKWNNEEAETRKLLCPGIAEGIMLFDKGKFMRLSVPSPWCRVWRIEFEDKFTWIEALDFMPEFSLCGLSGSEPCVFVDNRACW